MDLLLLYILGTVSDGSLPQLAWQWEKVVGIMSVVFPEAPAQRERQRPGVGDVSGEDGDEVPDLDLLLCGGRIVEKGPLGWQWEGKGGLG